MRPALSLLAFLAFVFLGAPLVAPWVHEVLQAAGFQNIPFGGQPAQTARPKGKMHGEVVSLRLEMAAYFKRANMAPVVQQPEAQ